MTGFVGAINRFVREVVTVDEAGVEAFEVGNYRIEVCSGFGLEGEGSPNTPLGFAPPQLPRCGNENIVSPQVIVKDRFDPAAYLMTGVSLGYRVICCPRQDEGQIVLFWILFSPNSEFC